MNPDLEKLDNPVWHALQETHREHALDFGNIQFYHPDYCPFGGFEQRGNISDGIEKYAAHCDNFFVVGEKPSVPRSLELTNELVCEQMVINTTINVESAEIIVPLTRQHAQLLWDLVNLVQPGYFRIKTSQLGNYYGIFIDDKLVAVTGERMQVNEGVEVSAVVTHPDHTGKGYAKQLVAHTVNNILQRDKLPFLHVAANNTGAINLYRKIGFTTRRKISFWNFVAPQSKQL